MDSPLEAPAFPGPVLAVHGPPPGTAAWLAGAVAPLVERGLRVAVVTGEAGADRLRLAGADAIARPSHGAAIDDPELRGILCAASRDHDIVLVLEHPGLPFPAVRVTEGAAPGDEIGRWLDESWAARPVHGGLLVGGASVRMGTPKQFLELRGRPLVAAVAEALAARLPGVTLLGAGPVPPALAALRRLADPPGLAGPLAGMLVAMRSAPASAWLFAACDMPAVTPAAVSWLLGQRRPGRWAVIPRLAHGPEPLLAVYEPQACPLLEDLAARGRAAPRRLVDHPMVATPEPPAALLPCFRNVNSAADLAGLER